MNQVQVIIDDVRQKGDLAVAEYTEKFDGVELASFKVTSQEINRAYREIDNRVLRAIEIARANIARFSQLQKSSLREFTFVSRGVELGQKIIPLQSVGCYVPGGRFPLFSTALMTVIPAKVARVKRIAVCSPKINSETIVAADLAGANEIYKIGGVQAIAAMAYGTRQIPKVDKIVGPGNKFVQQAKKLVYGDVGIDFIAGPSEVMVIADRYADPAFIASDLLAQAEHDVNALAILVTASKTLATSVKQQLELQLAALSTHEIAAKSLQVNGKIKVVKAISDAIAFANKEAPEHLELIVRNPGKFAKGLRNYGSLFIGGYAPEVFADYCSGLNHCLPTGGAARYTGGLSVRDFVKVVTFQKVSKKSSGKLASIASILAAAEGLEAHKRAAEIRVQRSMAYI